MVELIIKQATIAESQEKLVSHAKDLDNIPMVSSFTYSSVK